MPNSQPVSTSVRTAITPSLWNNIVKDLSRMSSGAGGTITIAAGLLTVNPRAGEGYYLVANEAAAAIDDIDAISTGGSYSQSDGDIVSLRATLGNIAFLKNNTGNILTPNGVDYPITSSRITSLRYTNASVWMVMSEGSRKLGIPTSVYRITVSTSSQDLVPYVATGIKVKQIYIKNTSTTVTALFTLTISTGGIPFVIPINLAPGERWILDFPIYLSPTMKITLLSNITCTAKAVAACEETEGSAASVVVAFTGTSYTQIIAVPSGHSYSIQGFLARNNDVTTETIGIQEQNASAGVIAAESRTLAPDNVWMNGENFVLIGGQFFMACHGTAAKIGTILVSYREVAA